MKRCLKVKCVVTMYSFQILPTIIRKFTSVKVENFLDKNGMFFKNANLFGLSAFQNEI